MARYGSGSVPIATGWKCTNCRRTHRSSIPRSASGNTRARPALTTDTSRPPRNWSAPCPGSSERCNTILSQSDPICFLFADRDVPLIMRGCVAALQGFLRRLWVVRIGPSAHACLGLSRRRGGFALVKHFELGELVQQLDGDLLGLIGQDLLAPRRKLEHSTTDALKTSGAMEVNRRPVDPVLVPGLRT